MGTNLKKTAEHLSKQYFENLSHYDFMIWRGEKVIVEKSIFLQYTIKDNATN